MAAKKPKEKRLRTSNLPERWVEASVRKDLRKKKSKKELGLKIGGIKETRTKDLLVEVKCAAKDRGRLDSAFRDIVEETGFVRHIIPTVEVEILDIDPTAESEEVTEAVRS